MSDDLEARAREVLSHIDPNCERAVWWKICAGVKNELGDAGFAAFDEWSAGGKNYNATATRSTWRSTNEMGGKTFATVVDIAKTDYHYVPKRGVYKKPTQAELDDRAQKYAARMAVHQAEEAKEAAEAAARATKRWSEAMGRPASPEHPYLKKKGVQPHGLRVSVWYKRVDGMDQPMKIDNVLYIPMVDKGKKVHSLQGITVEGEKLFLSGGVKKGHFYPLGAPKIDPETKQPIFVFAEGFATGASIHESTGDMVFCCFDLGNMVEVVKQVRAARPDAVLIIAADNDTETKGNPGMTQATAAAIAYHARLAAPPPGDFNDFVVRARENGLPEERVAVLVQKLFGAATVPTEPFVAPSAVSAVSVCHVEQPGPLTPGGEVGEAVEAPGVEGALTETTKAPMFQPSEMLPMNLPKSADARDGSTRFFALTEKGNTYRIANMHGNNIRFVTDLNQFLLWHEGHWMPDHGDRGVRAAIGRLPKTLREEATAHIYDGTPDDANHALKWAQKSDSAAVIGNAVTLLKDIGQLHAEFRGIDANPMVVGVDGGRQIVDLRDGSVRDARRDDLVTRTLGVREVGDASKAVRWQRFLAQVFSEDVELLDWFQRWIGYCLTGLFTEQIFLFLHGSGANGKSVLIKVLRTLFSGYGTVVAAGTLMEQQRTGKEASPDVLGMAGARLLLASEVAQGEAFDERFIKGWTGGDQQKARALHGKLVDFDPVGKLMIAGNHRPRIVGTDPAVWRRVRLVPFTRQFSEDERDPALPDRLLEELPHIAAWAVAGCLEWGRRGLADTPVVVKIASADYAVEQDTLGEFLADETVSSSGDSSTKELFEVYVGWAQECQIRAMSRQAFGRQLKERGHHIRHTRNGSVVEKLGLRTGPL